MIFSAQHYAIGHTHDTPPRIAMPRSWEHELNLWIELPSWLGAAAVLAAYARSASAPITPKERWLWGWANLFGALAMLAESATKGAWAPAALNLAWAIIAAVALAKGPRTTE